MSVEKQIEQMIGLLRDRKTNIKKMQKLSSVRLMDLTPKQANKRNADADWLGMANIKIDHELHALAVELGIAQRRTSYDEIELTDGWHRYKHRPREPFKDR
jgi:hypothetical protein